MPQVRVSQGMLRGKTCSTFNGINFYSFEGVPYAKPPVGDLRFKEPQEHDGWSGVWDATKPGNKCPQVNPFGNGSVEGCEDCLYLNIYTPILPTEEIKKLPVIFFIHGGRLTLGYGDYYRPDYFIQNDLILVTINYRLNVFGFLCLNTPEVPGNAGLKDTVMALKWVKNNIKNFNGDDDNITVFGESAGAAIGVSYLTSKMADGLFNKVICQSGTSISDLYIVGDDPVDRASIVASYLGGNTRDKKELYDIFSKASTEDLVYAVISAKLTDHPAVLSAFLLPVIEKKFDNVVRFFEEPPIVSIKEKRLKKLPVLVTAHTHEGALFVDKDENGNINYVENFEYFIPSYLFIKHGTPNASKFADKLRQYYFKGKKCDEKTKNEYLNLVSDHYFLRDIMLFVELLSSSLDVFMCRFGYFGNMNIRAMRSLGVKGATHGDLIQYIFYRESKVKSASEKDLMIAHTLVEAWCNFAKTGKPTFNNRSLDWQPYDTDKKMCLNVEDDIKVETFPSFERMKFWFDLIKERSKL
ncbi:esterase FE4-like isoform X2 [Nymphalis io]|nr:esterase FE4-like isoform X2 [Nymphalis io]